MSLRVKLVLAMMMMALVPMAIALAVPVWQAQQRVQQEAALRLSRAERQARTVVSRFEARVRERTRQAATDVDADRQMQNSLLRGPQAAADAVATNLAGRHALDRLDITDGRGAHLARHERALAATPASALALEFRSSAPATAERETVTLEGSVAVGREILDEVADLTRERLQLIDTSDAVRAERAPATRLANYISVDLPLADSDWRLRLFTAAGDVAEERAAVLRNFARLAPLALGAALIVGLLLAHGIASPIRLLTARAEQIARERSTHLLVDQPRNEVRRLTSSLDQMLEALAQSERERLAAERLAAWQEVARRIAHEVKNPLSPIKLAVENLLRTRERAPERFDQALQAESQTILEEVESLRRLVDEFSQFARLPAPILSRCDPRELLRKALALFAPQIAELAIAVHVDTDFAPTVMEADAEQLGRLLKNVLTNAIEALRPVEHRALRVVLTRLGDADTGRASFVIQDSGVGLSPEAQRRAFEPYFTTRGDSGGTGLGMAIAHRIVGEHGGTIEISGPPGDGARVTIEIPLHAARR